jgi:hypothetical protein
VISELGSLDLINLPRDQVFDCFFWGTDDTVDDGERFFKPTVPDSICAEDWTYQQAMFPALVWYWTHIRWRTKASREDPHTSWAELAMDFEASTHQFLGSPTDLGGEVTLERRARYFAAASSRCAQLCETQLYKGYDRRNKHKGEQRTGIATSANSLRNLGLTDKVGGFRHRAFFLRPRHVLDVLFRTAIAAADVNKRIVKGNSLKLQPEHGTLPEALWVRPALSQNLEAQTRAGRRRRIRGKKSADRCAPVVQAAADAVRTRGSMPRLTVGTRLLAGAATWTEEEADILRGLTGHALRSEQKRVLHNRHAAEKGIHVMKTTLRAGRMLARMTCLNCDSGTNRGLVTVWCKQLCKFYSTGRPPDASDGLSRSRGARKGSRADYLVKLKAALEEAGHTMGDEILSAKTGDRVECKVCKRNTALRSARVLVENRCAGIPRGSKRKL